MKRINGYIDVGQMLQLSLPVSTNITDFLKFLSKNNNSIVIRKKKLNSQFVFSFDYESETYYFKFDSLVDPYNELIFYYIAKDMGIDSLYYDLAIVGIYKGVISRDFKKKDADYILGCEILKEVYNKRSYKHYNNLEDIWLAIEKRYQYRYNSQEIVAKLMEKLVRIFIFDLLIGQEDRNSGNWGVVEYNDGNVDLQINLDNSRALVNHPIMVNCKMPMTRNFLYVEEMIKKFQTISSEEFNSLLPEFLWVISECNVKKIFDLIENQTNQEIPINLKEMYLEKFLIYYEYFSRLLGDLKTGGR